VSVHRLPVAARALTERRILDQYRPPAWRDTLATMSAMAMTDHPALRPFVPPALDALALSEAMIRSALWCTTDAPAVSVILVNDGDSRLTLG
jgi:hypothetical protein